MGDRGSVGPPIKRIYALEEKGFYLEEIGVSYGYVVASTYAEALRKAKVWARTPEGREVRVGAPIREVAVRCLKRLVPD